jgi:parallel beta-helix repeat protein
LSPALIFQKWETWVMKRKNLTRLLFMVLTVGLVVFGPNFGKNTTAALSANRYVAPGGSDTTDCSNSGSPCATIQYAVDQSLSGDIINVEAGTYSESSNLLVVDKTLTLLGAQAGVDARNPRGPESIISNSSGSWVTASTVVIDGFTIQDSSLQAFTGYGIWLDPAIDGTQILNNIFQNNVAGLGLSNGGASQALIKHNLFQNNNLGTGAAFGSGIYTDEFVGGAVSNVLIDENKFVDNNNAGVAFSSQDATQSSSNITITNNEFDSCGRGIYFYNTGSSTVTDNTITNSTVPTDGGTSVGIGVFGGVSDLSILRNNIETGALRGIRIGLFTEPPVSNANVIIHLNNIFGFVSAGLFVDDPALTGPVDFATCNYWGCACGPTHPDNPGGTGDVIAGNVVGANFDPWLFGLAPDSPCGVSPATTITACKFYDKNANGVIDGDDSPINGWPITISPVGTAVPNVATQLTADAGCVSWSTLDPALNPYTLSEGTPVQNNWIHTTPGSVLVNVVAGQTSDVKFGNVCLGGGGGLTIGFWGNKNGQNAIGNCTGGTVGVLAFLSGLNLRNANGSDFDPASYTQLKNWLGGANSTNMAYMLSVQLAAMELNVRCGGVNGSALIYAPGTLSANGAGFATVNAVMAEANTELGLHGLTRSGSPFRSYQESLKNALDRANNNLNFVQATPCPASF